jgi:hypothetical protein
VCYYCVDKNSNLLDLFKIEIEKNQTTLTKKQRGGDCDQREDIARVHNPVNFKCVVFSTNVL